MADQSHLDILQQGVEPWNSWREQNRNPYLIFPDLSGTDLSGTDLSAADLGGTDLSFADLSFAELRGANLTNANLSGTNLPEAKLPEADLHLADLSKADLSKAYLPEANLSEANLSGANLFKAHLSEANLHLANLTGANLFKANLSKANLSKAVFPEANLPGALLSGANLFRVDLSKANLSGAKLPGVNLSEANLSGANFSDADLTRSTLVQANLESAILTGCRIYGISAWSLKLEGLEQQNLNVSDYTEPAIMVDNLEVAQFIYLLLNNERIRQVIDTITSKVVLILGRFSPERKAVLDAIRDSLRQRDYLPVLFDFDKPAGRDLTETISTLAHMARFIIADITEARSIPQELQAIVPNLPSVPVQPLLLTSDREYSMFEHFRRFPWVLDTYYYDDPDELLASIDAKVISPAETKAKELSK